MRNGSRAVKKLLLLGVGSALMFTMGGVGPAQADNGPHISTAFVGAGTQTVATDSCATCHRAHTGKGALNLVQDETTLCTSCHGAGATGGRTDVLDGVGKGIDEGGALRAGGFDKAMLNASAPVKEWVPNLGTNPGLAGTFIADPTKTSIGVVAGQATTSQHNVGATGTVWGAGPITPGPSGISMGTSITLDCGSCHDPHGNGNYRILRPIPNGSTGKTPFVLQAAVVSSTGVVTTPAVMSPVTGIQIPDAPSGLTTDTPAVRQKARDASHVYTTTNYWLSGDVNVPISTTNGVPFTGTAKAADSAKGTYADLPTDGYIQNIAAWCTTCHTRYLAGSGSHSTNSGDATFMYRHRSDVNYKAGGANCITCHVAHGSNAKTTGVSNSVSLPGGVTAPPNDSRLLRVDNRGMCIMCHNK